MPSPLHITGIAILTSLLLTPVAHASKYEEDASQAISLAVRALRVQNEQRESTDQYMKALPLYNIKSLSYPVTWGFSIGKPIIEPTIFFSKKLSNVVTEKMLYKTPNFKNGMINVGAPLWEYHTSVYAPFLAKEAKTVYIKPIVPSLLSTDALSNGYIALCSDKQYADMSKSSEAEIARVLSGLEEQMKINTTLGGNTQFDGETYIPNVYSNTSSDTVFMGLPAKKFTLVFDSRINKTAVRLKYEGTYALKNSYLLCAEVVAPEKSFDVFSKAFDSIMASAVPSYEFGLSGKSSRASSTTPTKEFKMLERLCKRMKKC